MLFSLIDNDYDNSLENIFSDTSKFQLLDHDSTILNLSTVQSYLNMLYNHWKITLEDKNARPKFPKVGRAQGLKEIHKNYDHLPLFCPII